MRTVVSAISSVTSVLTYSAVGDPSENWIIACKFICLGKTQTILSSSSSAIAQLIE